MVHPEARKILQMPTTGFTLVLWKTSLMGSDWFWLEMYNDEDRGPANVYPARDRWTDCLSVFFSRNPGIFHFFGNARNNHLAPEMEVDVLKLIDAHEANFGSWEECCRLAGIGSVPPTSNSPAPSEVSPQLAYNYSFTESTKTIILTCGGLVATYVANRLVSNFSRHVQAGWPNHIWNLQNATEFEIHDADVLYLGELLDQANQPLRIVGKVPPQLAPISGRLQSCASVAEATERVARSRSEVTPSG